MTGLSRSIRLLNATDPGAEIAARWTADRAPEEDPIPTLRRYWNDPVFAAQLDAEQEAMRKKGRAAWDAATRKNHPHISQENDHGADA